MIRAEYLAGATARALAKKYRTSPTSIYRRASQERWTKQALGDAVARKGLAESERRAQAETQALEARAAPAEEPAPFSATPEELERRALAQAGAALAKGRAGDAKAFAALAEQMRKRAESARGEAAAEEHSAQMAQAEAEAAVCELFVKIAYVANAMVHAPNQAPAAFQGLVKLWREKNLGEGEADAERAAAALAASQAAYLDGRFEETLPEFVRERIAGAWAERRAALEAAPVIPQAWTPGAGAP